jgi:hypothetical protein
VRAHTVPLRVAQELGALQGCGPGTVAKVAEFLATYGEPAEGLVAEAAAAAKAAGREEEFKWLEESDKETVVDLCKKGEVPWAQAKAWRTDITEADWK